LKKDTWNCVVRDMNATFDIALDLQQLQNQNANLWKVYQDFKFLRDQSGFGWDEDLATPTADPKTWDELCLAHPKRHFDKLKGKSFPLYGGVGEASDLGRKMGLMEASDLGRKMGSMRGCISCT
jgi:hypothetical protein